MNFKTTLLLALVLVGLLTAYLWRPRADVAQSTASATPPVGSPGVSRDVTEQELGDVQKVVCRTKNGEQWVFEKDIDSGDAGRSDWRMTSPTEMKVVSWEVEQFGRLLGEMKYEVSYKPGDPGAVTASEAGLEPPEHVVTLTDAEGTSVTFEVGKPASSNSTYVRIAGSEEIFVGTRSLAHLFKKNAREHRDKQLWNFKPEDAKRVEVVDRSDVAAPITYTFARDGARWIMESPVTAKATSKIDDMIRTMSRMRANEWHDDKPERLAAYGLQPAILTIRATVEEEIPSDDEAETDVPDSAGSEAADQTKEQDEGKDDQPRTRLTNYELHFSDRSPIGEDTKTYLRVGDESMVAIVMKSTADKFKPVMAEWREMRVTTANVNGATRVGLSNDQGSSTLVKRDGRWWFAEDAGPAEDDVVKNLLDAISGLRAVAFVDGDVTDPAKFGLDQPQAEVELRIPGVEDSERITVGGHTDAKTKRLVYVRRNQVASVAKVRAADVAELLKGPRTFVDRTIFNIPTSRIEQITLSVRNQFAEGRMEVALTRGENGWAMTSPVTAPVRGDRVDKLVESLGGLRAESIVDQTGELSQYGLHVPSVRIVLTHKPPVEYRFEKPESQEPSGDEDATGEGESTGADDAQEAKKLVPVEVQPPAESMELLVAAHDGRYYAKHADRPTIYQVAKVFYDQLLHEYRTDEFLTFDAAAVRVLSIRTGGEALVFKRTDGRWIYETEPDLPLDKEKVDKLLLQLKDIRTDRYVSHAAPDLTTYGLADAVQEISITMDDGAVHALLVAGKACPGDQKKRYYASVDGSDAVFLLTRSDTQRFRVSLDDLETRP